MCSTLVLPTLRGIETVRVKEGCKVFTGIIDTIRSKSEIEQWLSEVELGMADADDDDVY